MKTIPPPYFPPPVSSGNFLSCTVQLPLFQQHKIKHGTQCSYFSRSQNLAGVRTWSLSSESWTVYHPCFSMWCIHFQLCNFVTFWGLPHPHRSSPSTVSDPSLSLIATISAFFFFFNLGAALWSSFTVLDKAFPLLLKGNISWNLLRSLNLLRTLSLWSYTET